MKNNVSRERVSHSKKKYQGVKKEIMKLANCIRKQWKIIWLKNEFFLEMSKEWVKTIYK
jgi:hypothetical protein